MVLRAAKAQAGWLRKDAEVRMREKDSVGRRIKGADAGVLKRADARVYELIRRAKELVPGRRSASAEYHKDIFEALKAQDSVVYELIECEYERLGSTIQLIAAENECSKAVLAALGSVVQNKTTEGFPGRRFHGGSEVVDELERLAVQRAKETFGAQYANVQPHSGTQANQIVVTALLARADKILSLGMDQGGHVSHGGKLSFAGKFFETENYSVDSSSFLLDYGSVRQRALAVRPRLLICGATAYPRAIDFEKFREIADEVGAYLLADVSHISGLIIAGAHRSCIDYAHFTTTSTYKPGGPRGGLILMGKDFDKPVKAKGKEIPLWKLIERATFPGVQGTPYLNHIAAKAVFFKETFRQEYRDRQFKIIENAQRLAGSLSNLGYDVLTGGTDTHMVLINVGNLRQGLTGVIAQKGLEDCGIIVNMNKLPYDNKSALVTSGIRLGTPIVTKNGMGADEMDRISELIDKVLKGVRIISDTEYEIDGHLKENVTGAVMDLRRRFAVG